MRNQQLQDDGDRWDPELVYHHRTIMVIPLTHWLDLQVPMWQGQTARMINLRLQHLGPVPIRFAHRRGRVECPLNIHFIRPSECYFYVQARNDWINVLEYFFSRYGRPIIDVAPHLGSQPIRFTHRGGQVHRILRVHTIRPSQCFFYNERRREWMHVVEYFYARYGMTIVDRNTLFSFEGREELGLFPLECLSIDE